MAPPIQHLPEPACRPRRPVIDVLAGLGAAALLLALMIGVPVALVTVLGSPIPHSMPSLSLLTQRLGILPILKILSLVVWLAWLQLVLCVVSEVRAAIRNTGMPFRVPLAGGIQPAVHRLVTAALLLFSAATALSPAFPHQAPPRAAQVVSAAPMPTPGSGGIFPAASPAVSQHQAGPNGVMLDATRSHALGQVPDRPPRSEKIYVVQPPEGRFHESLWEIAQNHLGDGRRYREIFELNKDRVQPDGSKLTIASLIRPGWILRMPRDAHGPGIKVVTVHDHASAATHGHGAHPDHDGLRGDDDGRRRGGSATGTGAAQQTPARPSPAQTPAPPSHAQPTPAQRGLGPAPPSHAQPTPAQRGLGPAPPSHAAQSPAQHPVPGGGVHVRPSASEHAYRYELAAASLLAAGVISALEFRRRQQRRHRAYGRRVARPRGRAAAAEMALRLGADEPSARLLDTGLRYLSQALAAQGRDLPTVFAAHVGSHNLDLWIAPADRDAPAPWVAVGDGQVWRLPFSAAPRLHPDHVTGVRAPYPGLVTIGTDATGLVLVDLETAHGLIAVTGPAFQVQAALAAMAVELATNLWSGPVQLTLVGLDPGLAELAPDRVSVVNTLAEALPALAARAEMVEEALAAARSGGILTGHPALDPRSWAPHYLISAVPPSVAEQDELLALAQTRHAAAAGYVVAGDIAMASWTWEVTEQGRLRTGLLGLEVQAQLLGAEQHTAVADLFQTAGQTEGVLLGAPPTDAAPAEHLTAASVMPVEITMLGAPAVRAPGVIEPERLAMATEMVIYLAVHPGGVHPNVLGAAIWPRGVTREVRDAMVARVRDWLGTDDIGRPHLATDASGRLRLGSHARVDWQVFCALIARAVQAAEDGPGAAPSVLAGGQGEEALLAQALNLVSGPFLAGREPGRYAWLASDGLEYEVEAWVADAAHRLGLLRLADGDPHGAIEAAHMGLRLAYGDELLWRDLLTAAYATGEEDLLREAVDEVCARAALDEAPPQMAPETEALIDELLPSWRSSSA